MGWATWLKYLYVQLPLQVIKEADVSEIVSIECDTPMTKTELRQLVLSKI